MRIKTPRVFLPLLEKKRYKAAYGGRGSGKSHFFAELLIENHVANRGFLSVCVREIQKSLRHSLKRLLEKKLDHFGLGEADGFKSYRESISTPGDGIIAFTGMQDHTADSIKSLEGFNRCLCDEAQNISSWSLMILRPTFFRTDDCEMWFSWNPRLARDPVDKMFRDGKPPTGSAVVEVNWRDNPFFPKSLNVERMDYLESDPEVYDHIWEGGYMTVSSSAYYAKHIHHARQEGRICPVAPDPLISYGAFVDIGGTGARSDAFSIWVAQFVGIQIRVLNYYEVQHQPIAAHLEWLRSNKYTPGNTTIWLPHDGATNDKVYDVSYQSALRASGYDVEVVPNQGKGAASARIEATRRLFPSIYIDEHNCQVYGGLDALSWYHEREDEHRNIGLGPEHDWSSHAADAFGLMAIVYEMKQKQTKHIEDPYLEFA